MKFAAGTNYTDQLFDISNAKAKSSERLGGFIGEIGAGYKINELFGLETMSNLKYSDKTYLLTPSEMASASEISFVSSGPYNSDTHRYYKESGLDLGGKVFTEYPWANNIYFTAGFGAGVSYKTLETKFSTVIKQDIVGVSDIPLNFSVKSKALLQPFGFIALGADYRLGDKMSAGVEYDLRFNNTKMYTAKSNVQSCTITPGSAANLNSGVVQMQSDPSSTKLIWTKGHAIGNTSKTNHVFKVRLKILL
jgi:hypothetical protein